jgi:hypothetical protein
MYSLWFDDIFKYDTNNMTHKRKNFVFY